MFIVTVPQKRSSSVGATWNRTCRPAGACWCWVVVCYKHVAPTELANPNGIPQQSPGLRGTSVRKANSVPVVLVSPGKTPPKNHNPERVAAPHEHRHDATNAGGHNPFRV